MNKYLRSIKTISILWLGALLGSAIGFATQVVLARELGVELYGLFASSLGTINLIMPLAGFGIASLWLKVFGEEGWSGVRWIKPSLHFLYISTIAVIIVINVWALIGSHTTSTKFALQLLSVTVIGQATLELLKSKLQLEEKYGELTLYQLAIPLLRFIFVLVLAFSNYSDDILILSSGYALLSIFVFSLSIYPLRCSLNNGFQLKGHGKGTNNEKGWAVLKLTDVLRCSWVFGFATMFYVLWSQSNIVLLKYIAGDSEAGVYNVALLIITAICILPSVIYSKYLMPKIHRWASHDQLHLRKIFYLGNKWMFIIGLFFMLGIMLSSKQIIMLIFGGEYIDAIAILFTLSLTLPIRFVGHSVGALLVAREYMKVKVKVMALVAMVNILLNLFAIPYAGLIGVAYVAIFCELLLLALYYALVRIFYIQRDWQ